MSRTPGRDVLIIKMVLNPNLSPHQFGGFHPSSSPGVSKLGGSYPEVGAHGMPAEQEMIPDKRAAATRLHESVPFIP